MVVDWLCIVRRRPFVARGRGVSKAPSARCCRPTRIGPQTTMQRTRAIPASLGPSTLIKHMPSDLRQSTRVVVKSSMQTLSSRMVGSDHGCGRLSASTCTQNHHQRWLRNTTTIMGASGRLEGLGALALSCIHRRANTVLLLRYQVQRRRRCMWTTEVVRDVTNTGASPTVVASTAVLNTKLPLHRFFCCRRALLHGVPPCRRATAVILVLR